MTTEGDHSSWGSQSLTLTIQLLPGVLVEIILAKLMVMADELRAAGAELRTVVIDLPQLSLTPTNMTLRRSASAIHPPGD
jgi:hypothetical protein